METISLLLGLLGLAGDGWGLLRSRKSGDLRQVTGRLSQRLPFSASLDAAQLARLFSDRRFLDALDAPDSPRDGLRTAVVENLGGPNLQESELDEVIEAILVGLLDEVLRDAELVDRLQLDQVTRLRQEVALLRLEVQDEAAQSLQDATAMVEALRDIYTVLTDTERQLQVEPTTPELEVECCSGFAREGIVRLPLGGTWTVRAGRDSVPLPEPHYLGVDCRNVGRIDVDVDRVCIEIDVGHPEHHISWLPGFVTETPLPCRLRSHGRCSWFVDTYTLAVLIREISDYGPQRFRATVQTGSSLQFESPWYSIALLPMWDHELSEDEMRQLGFLGE